MGRGLKRWMEERGDRRNGTLKVIKSIGGRKR
jgi:hypothetical protein